MLTKNIHTNNCMSIVTNCSLKDNVLQHKPFIIFLILMIHFLTMLQELRGLVHSSNEYMYSKFELIYFFRSSLIFHLS